MGEEEIGEVLLTRRGGCIGDVISNQTKSRSWTRSSNCGSHSSSSRSRDGSDDISDDDDDDSDDERTPVNIFINAEEFVDVGVFDTISGTLLNSVSPAR